ncbi:MAG: aspartate carbamoyltransferase regulatory subunit [Bacteroidales bacterium]|nr:aspartate carbamoyltransferase regulatory subunit [Bacteroidales bacterium]
MSDKELTVSAIKNGTVLDHIPADKVYRALELLGLTEIDNQITIGINLRSKGLGSKGIIKIADKFFDQDALNRLALIAPQCTVNIIRDYKVAEKHKIGMPEEIIGMEKCMNPKCVTNHQPIKTRFSVIQKDGHTGLLCHYCEKITNLK